MFYNWRRAYQNKTSAYTKRLNALNRIWALKKQDVGKEV
jgi:phage-related minor tail protein